MQRYKYLTESQERIVFIFVNSILGLGSGTPISVVCINHRMNTKSMLSNLLPNVYTSFTKDILLFDKTHIALNRGITKIEPISDELIFNLSLIIDKEEIDRYKIASTVVQEMAKSDIYNFNISSTVVSASYIKLLDIADKITKGIV